MKSAMKPLTLPEIDVACQKVLANARALLDESDILHERKRFARAYFLGHIAGEELAKLDLLVSVAVGVLRSYEIDWAKFDAEFRSHRAKIKLLFGDALRHEAKGDVERLEQILAVLPALNDWKNYALYVGQKKGEGPDFRTPAELVPEELSAVARDAMRAALAFYESVIPNGRLADRVNEAIKKEGERFQ